MQRLLAYFKNNKKKTIVLFLLLVAYYFCLPKHLFKDPTATVITSNKNELLGALIADEAIDTSEHEDKN